MSDQPIYVTRPHLPPLGEFIPYLESIWASGTLTNGGPMHRQLEQALGDYLGVDHLALVANGTVGLITALQALEISGEVITTPYSFVATTHALLWNGIRPVFADIEPDSFNLDPARIEAAITPATTAIMPVHCYGNPCAVEAIQRIADRHGLKVIYDAAHAFGVRHRGQSILGHGDLSILSFHATKAFHTFEGGAIVCPDAATKAPIRSSTGPAAGHRPPLPATARRHLRHRLPAGHRRQRGQLLLFSDSRRRTPAAGQGRPLPSAQTTRNLRPALTDTDVERIAGLIANTR